MYAILPQHISEPGQWTNSLASLCSHKTMNQLCGTLVQQRGTTNSIVPGWVNVHALVSPHYAVQCCQRLAGQKTWHARYASNWKRVGCSMNQWAWMRLNYLCCSPYRR